MYSQLSRLPATVICPDRKVMRKRRAKQADQVLKTEAESFSSRKTKYRKRKKNTPNNDRKTHITLADGNTHTHTPNTG